jgi:hypothetical protein
VSSTGRKDGLYDIDLSGAAWCRSSYSNGAANCVEMADLPCGIAVRDSKDPERAPLRYTVGEWHAFCRGVIEGAL